MDRLNSFLFESILDYKLSQDFSFFSDCQGRLLKLGVGSLQTHRDSHHEEVAFLVLCQSSIDQFDGVSIFEHRAFHLLNSKVYFQISSGFGQCVDHRADVSIFPVKNYHTDVVFSLENWLSEQVEKCLFSFFDELLISKFK